MTLVRRFNYPFYSMFDNFFNDELDRFSAADSKKNIPAVNVKETENGYHLEVVAPGYKRDDFKIKLDKDLLTISSEMSETKEEKEGEKHIRREYKSSSFTRSFTLPQNINAEKISASYEDGLLKITLPKVEVIQHEGGREISIA
ncbi:Hsp20 family protein [bacterium]|nr:Hsp20 family protein [bacterium]